MNRPVFTCAVPVRLLASAFAAMPLAAGAAAVVAGNLAATPVDESAPIVVAQLGGGGGTINLGPRISTQPLSATVGNGSGVRFSVGVLSSTGAPRYQWYGPTGAIPGATGASYSIAGTTPAHQGNYSVRVSDTRGSVTSSTAKLTVVSAAWAPLGGRSIFTSTASQQPSLALCAQPTVAWIDTSAGPGLLNVWAFNGTDWASLGGAAVNQSTMASAAEPSLDCVEGRPVVAWTEGAAAARSVYVKRWDGSAWVALSAGPRLDSSLNQNTGATALKPILRVNSSLPTARTPPLPPYPLQPYSALAWIEDGQAKAKFFNGVAWQFYTGGAGPNGIGVTDIALALDFNDPSTVNALPPMLALVAPASGGQKSVLASTYRGSWRALGAGPSPLIPAGTSLTLGGIGPGADRIGRLAVTTWITQSPNYSLESALFASSDYTHPQLGLIAPSPVWEAYAPSYGSGSALKAASFDPREFRVTCFGDRTPTYGWAVGRAGTFEVLRTQCADANGPFGWKRVRPPHQVTLEAMSLRMAAEDDPYVAGVELVNGQYVLSVWRYAP